MLMLTTNAPLEEVVKILDAHLSPEEYDKMESIEPGGHAYSAPLYIMEISPVDDLSRKAYFELHGNGNGFVRNPASEIWGECHASLSYDEDYSILREDFEFFEELLRKHDYSAHIWEFEEE